MTYVAAPVLSFVCGSTQRLHHYVQKTLFWWQSSIY